MNPKTACSESVRLKETQDAAMGENKGQQRGEKKKKSKMKKIRKYKSTETCCSGIYLCVC
jgi:hypothetical protein